MVSLAISRSSDSNGRGFKEKGAQFNSQVKDDCGVSFKTQSRN